MGLPLGINLLNQFVHAPQRRRIDAGGQFRAHPKNIDRGLGREQFLNFVFVHIAADHNFGKRQTCLVENLANVSAETEKIATVEAHALNFWPKRSRIAGPLQGIVGVDQQGGVFGKCLMVSGKGLFFAFKGHGPGMGCCAFDGQAQVHPGIDIGSGGCAANIRCTGGEHTGFGPVGPAGPKVDKFHRFFATVAGQPNAGCFAGHGGLVIDQ